MREKSDVELTQILWDYNNIKSPLKKADIILGLGNNDIKTASYAAQLYLERYAPLILFTGQYGLLTKNNFAKTEAEVFADEALKLGVPKEKILIENKATNTGENIEFAKRLLEQREIKTNRLIVIAKPHQLRRAFATFEKVWPGKELILSSISTTMAEYVKENSLDLNNFINALVGVTHRVLVYPGKGFQISQEMPDEVFHAFKILIERGYDKQLVS